MRLAAFLFLVFVSLTIVMTAAAAVIDTGFAQDGKTTYCQGIRQKQENPLVFDQLETSSAGACPIAVEIKVASTTIAPLATLDVTWAASLYTGVMTKNLFPAAVNNATKQASPVISSLLRACKSGTNCAADSVIYPATVPGDPSTDAGPFDASGKKTLQRFKIQFPTAGEDYVLVGKVVLTGDQAQDISATEFIAFQRIHVGTEDAATTNSTNSTTSTPPATVKPANISDTATSTDATPTVKPNVVSAASPETTTAAKTSSPDQNVSTSADGGGIDMETVSIVGVIGLVVILIVVGYSFVVHREKSKLVALRQNQTNPSPTLSFESHNNNINGTGEPMGAFAPPGRQTNTVRKSIAPPPMHYEMHSNPMENSMRKESRDRAPPPPRPSQPPPLWLKPPEPYPAPPIPQTARQVSVSSAVTLEYSNSGHSDESVFSLGDATNMSSFEPSNIMVDTSNDEIEDFRDNRHSSVALLESSPTGSEISDVSSLGSLHDSGDHLEPHGPPRRTTFSIDDSSRASSSVLMESSSSIFRESSSYRESSYRESSYRANGESAFYRPSSRLYSESTVLSVHGPRSTGGSSVYYPRDTSEYNAPYTDRNSESDEWVRRTTDGHYML